MKLRPNGVDIGITAWRMIIFKWVMLVYAMQGHVSHKQDFRTYKQCERVQLAWLRSHKSGYAICSMNRQSISKKGISQKSKR